MLNKLKFNNLVISNKKGIQQSRIQTINKLVRKIRKLKSQLEKHPEDKKCKDRIRKSTETMELLKKFKLMDIMKKVLLMDKPPAAIISNGIATPEEVAVALLCMNKVMQVLLKRFKTELLLNESGNVEWKDGLMEPSKRKQKIEKTEEKRRKRLQLKQQKVMGRKRQEWLEENQRSTDETIAVGTDGNTSTTGSWKIEELANDDNEDVDEDSEIKFNVECKRDFNEKSNNINPVLKSKPKPASRTESKKAGTKKFEQKQTTSNELNAIEGNHCISEINRTEVSNATFDDKAESLAIDPFFITDTGENYLSSAIIKRENSVQDGGNSGEKRNLHMIKLNRYGKSPSDRIQGFQTRDQNRKYVTHKNNWIGERGYQNKLNSKSKIETKKYSEHNRNERKNITNNRSEDKDLHPSWAAKQKLKPIITGFQGKKIKFDDDGCKKMHKLEATDIKTEKSTTSTTNKSEKDSLHPSWAAKQKLKSSITAFQGKKITFDHDD